MILEDLSAQEEVMAPLDQRVQKEEVTLVQRAQEEVTLVQRAQEEVTLVQVQGQLTLALAPMEVGKVIHHQVACLHLMMGVVALGALSELALSLV
jgi:hypothetical protein